jgi:hypothetical protein
MARTRAEVRAFLDSKVGTIVPHPGYPDLNGQCVTLTKALMEFLGVPNPYKARGNARDAGDTYLREGIADNGVGWLTIVVNRDMGYIGGVRYGHIWVDLQNEANYESNGNRALYTTKNTRPISQGQQFINLDKWIGDGKKMIENNSYWVGFLRIIHSEIGGWDLHKTHAGEYDKLFMDAWYGKSPDEAVWGQWNNGSAYRTAKEAQKKAVVDLTKALNGSKAELEAAQKAVAVANAKVVEEVKKATDAGIKEAEARAEAARIKAELDAKIQKDKETDEQVNGWLRSLWNKLTGGK